MALTTKKCIVANPAPLIEYIEQFILTGPVREIACAAALLAEVKLGPYTRALACDVLAWIWQVWAVFDCLAGVVDGGRGVLPDEGFVLGGTMDIPMWT